MDDIEKAIARAWSNATPRRAHPYLKTALTTATILGSVWFGYYLHHATWRPADIDELLSRSTYIAAHVTRTPHSELLQQIQWRIGKPLDKLSAADEAAALDFIFDMIEQHQFRQSAYQ